VVASLIARAKSLAMTKRRQVRIGAAGLVTGTELSNTTRNSLRVTTNIETQTSTQADYQTIFEIASSNSLNNRDLSFAHASMVERVTPTSHFLHTEGLKQLIEGSTILRAPNYSSLIGIGACKLGACR
jgi:hypothetical protein